MCDDERQCVRFLRADVDEVNIDAIYVRHELRQGVQPRFDLTPVVCGLPVARELPHGRKLHPLGRVMHHFAIGPVRRGDPPAKVRQSLIRSMKVEGADRTVSRRCAERRRRGIACNHDWSPLVGRHHAGWPDGTTVGSDEWLEQVRDSSATGWEDAHCLRGTRFRRRLKQAAR